MDYSYQAEKTQKMKDRWMRVLENKEKLTVDRLTLMRSKLELKMKIEKDKKKKADETHEDRVFISKLLTL